MKVWISSAIHDALLKAGSELHLILLDQGKLVSFKESGAAIYGVRAASVQLCGLALVDGSVARLCELRQQEVVKVVALHLLPSHKASMSSGMQRAALPSALNLAMHS